VQLERSRTRCSGLQRGRLHDADRFIPLQNRERIVAQIIVIRAIRAQEGRDPLRFAHKSHHRVDHMAAELEHDSAREARQFRAVVSAICVAMVA
jgi:hypothetical protein